MHSLFYFFYYIILLFIFVLFHRLVSKAEKNLTDHTEFIAAKEKVEEWLNRAHGTVQDCIGEGDLSWVKDKLQTVNLVSSRITEGINKLLKTNLTLCVYYLKCLTNFYKLYQKY